MALSDKEIEMAAKAIFELSIHYHENSKGILEAYTWDTYDNAGKDHYMKCATVALWAAEKARKSERKD